ncbi:hypothetical protein HDU85_003015 [Gaertneriomyces sp. JEL0708]|nr:hypothetical protein HDU85_003015 [Gaertneriomyces sp. JEL0708]
MFDLTTRAPIKTFAGHVAQVQCIQVLVPHSPPIIDNVPYPHGILLTASLDNTLKLFSLQTGECIKTLFGHLAGVWSCAIDTLRIVSGSQDRSVKIWEVSGEGCVTLTGHNGAVNCVSVSDRCVVTGGEDGVVRVWDFGVRGLPASGENVKADANGTALANTATPGDTNAPGIVQNGFHTNTNEESGG